MKLLFIILIIAVQALAQTPDSDLESKQQLVRVWLEENLVYYHIPGISVAVMYDDSLLWEESFGVKSLESGEIMTPQTLFRIASISKIFTSTAIMQLRDRNKLRLDDPAKIYLPWFKIKNPFPEAPPVTIRQLLSHTSGLPRESEFPYWTDHQFPDREEMIEMLSQQEMVFPPETKLKYSNLGMALLGEIVSSVSGISYSEYVEKHILQPLGLNSTKVILTETDRKNLATGYLRFRDGKTRQNAPFTDAKGLIPAANLSSSVSDLVHFCEFFYDTENPKYDKILKSSTRLEMMRPQWMQAGWESAWGLGFSLSKNGRNVLVGHGGWVAGYRSQILFDPDKNLAVVVMMNTEDFSPYRFARKILDIFNSWQPESIQNAVMDFTLQKYCGQFMDTSFWQVNVLGFDQTLAFYDYSYPPSDDPRDNLRYLTPVGGTLFRLGGETGNGEPVLFFFNPDGQVERIKIDANFIYPLSQME